MIVPILERPDAEAAPGEPRCRLRRLDRRRRPVRGDGARCSTRTARYAISDSAWAMHVLGLQRALPESGYVSMTQRAADAARGQGRRRDRAPGRRGRRRRRQLEEIVAGALRGAARERGRRRPRRLPAQARPLAGRLHRRRLGPQRRQPAPRDGRADDRGRATWSSSTSAASRTATAPTRPAPCTSGSRPTRSARCFEIVAPPSRPASRPCAPASPARRSTAPRAR